MLDTRFRRETVDQIRPITLVPSRDRVHPMAGFVNATKKNWEHMDLTGRFWNKLSVSTSIRTVKSPMRFLLSSYSKLDSNIETSSCKDEPSGSYEPTAVTFLDLESRRMILERKDQVSSTWSFVVICMQILARNYLE